MIMNPMQMVLTKDHVKVLMEIVPKSTNAKNCFPAMDSMAHIKYINDLFVEMQDELVNQEDDEACGLSAIKRHLK